AGQQRFPSPKVLGLDEPLWILQPRAPRRHDHQLAGFDLDVAGQQGVESCEARHGYLFRSVAEVLDEELLLSLGADRDEIDVESTDVFSVVGHHPLCGSDSVLEEYLICPQGSFEPGLPRRVGEVRMVGPDDLVGGERYLDVVMRTEVDDIVVTVKIDSFGGV